MATELITFKMESKFLDDIDKIVKKEGYQNRTEFIRNALREKLEESKLKETMIEIAKFKGAAKKKVTEEEYERVREQAFEEISKKLR